MNFKLALESADGRCVSTLVHPVVFDRHDFDVYATFDNDKKVDEGLEKLTAEVEKFPVKDTTVKIINREKQDVHCWYAQFLVSYTSTQLERTL